MLKEFNSYRNSIQSRANKVRSDYQDRFLKNVPMKLKKNYGSKSAAIAFTLLSIQKSVIKNDSEISCPSVVSLALAHNVSERQVTRVIETLISNGALHLRNYFKTDDNGEVLTRETSLGAKFNNVITKRRITNGKLRLIINPFKKVKEFIQAKASEKTAKAKELVEPMFEKLVRSFWRDQQFDVEYSGVIKSDSDNDPWDIEL